MTQRRSFLQGLAGLGIALALGPGRADAARAPLTRPIPSTGERIPLIGVGSWLTFDTGAGRGALERLQPVLQTFFDHGGRLIDSSPMYGTAERVIGELLPRVNGRGALFAATKVWIYGQALGRRQMEASRSLWGVPRFDLMQIHNMLDWEGHLEVLREMKREGRIRYIGITTSHGRRHDELLQAMQKTDFDFVQFTYGLHDRDAESRLLPLAAERRMAVIANRPFDGGALFGRVQGKPLPDWAAGIDCANWAQLFLKFVVSHPAVTCAIPATSNPAHMLENMGANFGRLPDAALRRRMAQHFDGI
ncbi:NADH-specific methylglyoxal reductase [Rhodocyclaceae bacterium]|jgi:diketogulonate reductase-like aldo/keto reductase|nr:NADH-specific methylglyoxal reductase [Rhodocyclaceae bacterium]